MNNLFVNFYNDKNPTRQQEINECIARNIENVFIDKIYFVISSAGINYYGFDASEKIEIIFCEQAPTFSYFFRFANSKIKKEHNISIIANLDIYFEEYDLSLADFSLQPVSCFALSRWDKNPDNTLHLFERVDSQDCWMFRGFIKHIADCDFTMGIPGCDNAIAQRIEAAGYMLQNPSKDIKAIHVHTSGIRNYDTAAAAAPPYRYIQPETLGYIPRANWVTGIADIFSDNRQSQFEEEAIIEHIFKHIGVTNRYMVDIGAAAYGDSTMSNTRRLKQAGWDGIGIDIKNKGEYWIIERYITPNNIVSILQEQQTPKQFDFLNLDIDSCDFWVLQNLLKEYLPRCICTEFNGTLDPSSSLVLRYQPGYVWDNTNNYGYSFAAGKKLLAKYNYRIIYNQRNQNIFAVKKELVSHLVFKVEAAQVIYHPINMEAVWDVY